MSRARAPVGAALLALALALPVAAGADGGAGTAPAPAPPSAPRLALHACRLHGLEHDALCGSLPRALDPAHPEGTRLALQVAVVPALARRKRPDPVLFFAGGPGQSAIALAGTIERLTGRLGERRDLVLIDQRGTGRSAPLQCDSPGAAEALQRALDPARQVAAMQACRRALGRLPWGDLRFYTTSLAVTDADAVREALGADRVDLVGVSYGTRVALEYLRRYPQHVRRVVLDGVAPPDMVLPESAPLDAQAALDAAWRACAAEPGCARAYPHVAATWARLVAAPPRRVTVVDPSSGQGVAVTMTARALRDLVRPALYQPALGAVLPYAVESAAAGRFEPLLALGGAAPGSAPEDLSEGEHFAVICSEDAPRLSWPGVSSPGLSAPDPSTALRLDDRYRQACADWPRGAVDPAFYLVGRSAAPVLLLSGGLDPITPPRHAARVAAALGPLARSYVVPQASHGVLALPCMRDVLFRFVDEAEATDALAVQGRCAEEVPHPLAFSPPQPQAPASAPNDPRGYGLAPPEGR